MEEKSFLWLLNLCASKQVRIPLLDCYFAKANKLIAYYFCNKENECCFEAENLNILEVFSKIYREFLLLQKLRMTGDVACVLFIGGTRHPITGQDLEMLISTSNVPECLEFIQLPKPCTATHAQYSFRTELAGGKYSSSCHCMSKRHKEPCRDENTVKKATALARTIITFIEKYEYKTVVSLEFECARDAHGGLWVADLPKLQLAPTGLSQKKTQCSTLSKLLRSKRVHRSNPRKRESFRRSSPGQVPRRAIRAHPDQMSTSMKRLETEINCTFQSPVCKLTSTFSANTFPSSRFKKVLAKALPPSKVRHK